MTESPICYKPLCITGLLCIPKLPTGMFARALFSLYSTVLTILRVWYEYELNIQLYVKKIIITRFSNYTYLQIAYSPSNVNYLFSPILLTNQSPLDIIPALLQFPFQLHCADSLLPHSRYASHSRTTSPAFSASNH